MGRLFDASCCIGWYQRCHRLAIPATLRRRRSPSLFEKITAALAEKKTSTYGAVRHEQSGDDDAIVTFVAAPPLCSRALALSHFDIVSLLTSVGDVKLQRTSVIDISF